MKKCRFCGAYVEPTGVVRPDGHERYLCVECPAEYWGEGYAALEAWIPWTPMVEPPTIPDELMQRAEELNMVGGQATQSPIVQNEPNTTLINGRHFVPVHGRGGRGDTITQYGLALAECVDCGLPNMEYRDGPAIWVCTNCHRRETDQRNIERTNETRPT